MNYQSTVEPGAVMLYVNDLQKVSHYYQNVIGLQRITQSENQISLGVDQTTLLHLVATERPRRQTYGLYHIALLVPKRQDLGNFLQHLINLRAPIVGAADHGYSEAMYLEDPEGNGIEVYVDKSVDVWDIRPNGQIVGVTEEIDADGVLAARSPYFSEPYQLPSGTRMGHVHLSVRDANETSAFYQAMFNLNDKFSVPSASWIAGGQYHHHLAFNQWSGSNLPKREDGEPGLGYFTLRFASQNDWQTTINNLSSQHIVINHLDIQNHQAEFVDDNGLKVKLILD